MLTLNDKLRIPDHVVCRKVGTKTVVLDMSSGNCFGIDLVGCRFFELLESDQPLAAIAARMVDEFDVTREQIAADLIELSAQLMADGLLEKA